MRNKKLLEIWTIFGMLCSIIGCIGVLFAGVYALLFEIIGFIGFCSGFYLTMKNQASRPIIAGFFLSSVCFVLSFLLLFMVTQTNEDTPQLKRKTEINTEELINEDIPTEILTTEIAENLTEQRISEAITNDVSSEEISQHTSETGPEQKVAEFETLVIDDKTFAFPFSYKDVQDYFPLGEYPLTSFTIRSSADDIDTGIVCDFSLEYEQPVENAVVTRIDASVFDSAITHVDILGISLEMPDTDAVELIEQYDYTKANSETNTVYTLPCYCQGEPYTLTVTILRKQGVVGEIQLSAF